MLKTTITVIAFLMIIATIIGCSGGKGIVVTPQEQGLNQELDIEGNFEDFYLPEDEDIEGDVEDFYLPEDGDIDIDLEDFYQPEDEYVEINPEDFYPPEDEGCLGNPEDFTLRVVASLNPPTNVQASDGTYDDKIRISWNGPYGAIRYNIWRATSQYGTYKPRDNTTNEYYNDMVYNTGTYWYKVSAVYWNGQSSKAGPNSGWKKYPPGPRNISASDGTYDDKIRISWSSPDDPDTPSRYNIWRATSQYGTYKPRDKTTSTYYNDIVYNTNTYWYKIQAVYSNNQRSEKIGPNSGWKKYPPAPTNVQASDGTYPDDIYVTWNRPTGVYPSRYNIWRATSQYGTYKPRSNTTNTYYSDIIYNTNTYWYKVQAVYSNGQRSEKAGPDSGYKGDDDLDPPTLIINAPEVTSSKHCISLLDTKLSYDCSNGKFTYNVHIFASDPSGIKLLNVYINDSVKFAKSYPSNPTAINDDFDWEFRPKDTNKFLWKMRLFGEDKCGNQTNITKYFYTIFFPGWPSGSSGNPACNASYNYGSYCTFTVGEWFIWPVGCKAQQYDGNYCSWVYNNGSDYGVTKWEPWISKSYCNPPVTKMYLETYRTSTNDDWKYEIWVNGIPGAWKYYCRGASGTLVRRRCNFPSTEWYFYDGGSQGWGLAGRVYADRENIMGVDMKAFGFYFEDPI